MGNTEEDQLNSVIQQLKSTFSFPLALLAGVFRILSIIFNIITLPLRIIYSFAVHFPITFTVILIFVFTMIYLFRRITAQRFVNYILYTIIPYIGAIAYSAVAIFFPQVGIISRIIEMVLHPIRWLLGMASTVDERAVPFRNAVEMIAPPKHRRPLNAGRLLCTKCFKNEKSILLLPCSHVALCDKCYQKISKIPTFTCPMCQLSVENTIRVEI